MIERLTVLLSLCCLAGSCGSPAMASTPPAEAAGEHAASGSKAAGREHAGAEKPAGEPAKAACACDPAELGLMTAFRARQLQLEERERKVVEHEAVLGRIEAELAGRLQAAVDNVRRLEEQANAKVGAPCAKDASKDPAKDPPKGTAPVSGALAALTPRKAAAILAAADGAVATQLLNELGAEKSAAILATMEPATAAGLVQRMTKRPVEPDPAPAPPPARRGRGGKEGR